MLIRRHLLAVISRLIFWFVCVSLFGFYLLLSHLFLLKTNSLLKLYRVLILLFCYKIRFSTFTEVAKEYEKNSELKKEDVQLLQKWMDSQQHLPQISELDMIFFLHSCYYNIDLTKQRIETFYSFKEQCPAIFKNRNPSKIEKTIKGILFTPLPNLTPEGYQILYGKYWNFDVKSWLTNDFVKNFDMAAMLMLYQTGTAAGHIIMVDLGSMTSEEIQQLDPRYVGKYYQYVQGIWPVRLKKHIFINVPSCINELLSIAKPFLKEELVAMFETYTTNDMDQLYNVIPKRCFPSDYGGQVESISELTCKRNENFAANSRFFTEDEEKVADESKRFGKPVSAQNILDKEESSFSSTYGV